LWRIHENRQKRGKEGTKDSSGFYSVYDHVGDRGYPFQIRFNLRLDTIVSGIKEKTYLANPFIRFHESIENYPDELNNADDIMQY